jgi:Ti-type conjugative transfer relaxase TraA
MLSLSPPKSAGGAMSYFSNQLVEGAEGDPEDYYSNSDESPGRWRGRGADALGLAGEVDSQDFARTLLGYDKNYSKLVQNAGDSERRAGQDLTFSAPKSVSVLWGLTKDKELQNNIQEAQKRSVDKALQKIENEYLLTRRGKGGQDRENAEMVAAVFDHQTSREQDPQLHSHCFVMNVCRREDGSFGTIDNSIFYKIQKEVGAYYRVALAAEMKNLGLAVERDGESFRLANIDPKLEKIFSKRRDQIEQKLSETGGSGAKASEIAALDSRKKKENLGSDELQESWQTQSEENGISNDNLLDHEPEPVTDEQQPVGMPADEELLLELTQHASTVSLHQLKAAVYQHSQTVLSEHEAEQYIDELMQSDELIKLRDSNNQPRFTSREMLQIEQRLADNAKARQDEDHQVSDEALRAALDEFSTLSDEQKNMLHHVTAEPGVVAVQGMAGTGKSFALAAARHAWERDGKMVVGCALAGKAAAGLEDGSGIKSQTLHSLAFELDNNQIQLSDNHVIVVDEAGMVGSRQLDQLLQHANEAGAKVVLVGDSKQLQPIDAGGAFRLISDEIGAAELSDIRRQKQGWHREAVHAFAAGQAGKALQEFDRRGLVHVEKDHDQVIKQLAENYLSDFDNARPGETLMIAGTRRDVALLNRETRAQLKAVGALSGESATAGGVEYTPGDRILFTRNNKPLDVKNGDLATLQRIERRGDDLIFHAKTDGGKDVEFSPGDYEHFQHGYAVTAHKSQGVTVDRAHVLLHDGMSDREWSYVAASRSRDDTSLYCTSGAYSEAARAMSRSRQADTTQDYQQEETEMAQIAEIDGQLSDDELESRAKAEIEKLSAPGGFDELLDEIDNDEAEDEARRARFNEIQRLKEEEEEEEEKRRDQEEEEKKKEEEKQGANDEPGGRDKQAEEPAMQPEPETEIGGVADEQPEQGSGFEMEM